jgi:hypothetical protein
MGANERVAPSKVRRVQARRGSESRLPRQPVARLRDRVTSLLALVIPLVVVASIGGIALVRAGAVDAVLDPSPDMIVVGAESLTPDDAKAAAASKLEAATAKGGAGYVFEIVQTSTIMAKPGGPKIDAPDPADPLRTLRKADEYLFYSLIERGTVTPAGFWSELRVGPNPGEKPDFEKAELRRSALVRDGVSWRNDRDGWYQADVLPGIGLDPETATLLPQLLRNANDATAKDGVVVGDKTLPQIAATGREVDIPGLVAAKGVAYTDLIAPIEFALDEQGRLARIHAVALNTTMTDFDLVVDTVIVLRYDDAPGPLPDPVPTWDPATTKVEE